MSNASTAEIVWRNAHLGTVLFSAICVAASLLAFVGLIIPPLGTLATFLIPVTFRLALVGAVVANALTLQLSLLHVNVYYAGLALLLALESVPLQVALVPFAIYAFAHTQPYHLIPVQFHARLKLLTPDVIKFIGAQSEALLVAMFVPLTFGLFRPVFWITVLLVKERYKTDATTRLIWSHWYSSGREWLSRWFEGRAVPIWDRIASVLSSLALR